MPLIASPEYIRAFADSMPDGYRDRHDATAIAAHARVARSREDRPAIAGIVSQGGPGEAAMCVIAQDRPGLLSTISAAFVFSGMDVVAAEAFTRVDENGQHEAVDLFWIRRRGDDRRADPVTEADADAITRLLVDLIEGRMPGDTHPDESQEDERSSTDTTVRFLDDKGGGLVTLEVETDDRSGLLMALSRALFEQRVQILRSEVKTVDRRVYDRFTVVEFDGSPISPARRLEIQVAVLTAVEPAKRARVASMTQNAET